MEKRENNYLSAASEIQFAVAESYKTVRTNLIFLLAQNPGCKTITVSSCKAGEGKTTNAINIAIAFSQLGKRVLLIDADLRRPSVAKRLRIENTVGFSGVLAGFATISEAIVNVNNSFDVLPSGSVPPNPAELLSSTAVDHVLDSLRLVYDYIIIDTSPAGIVSDALMLAPKTDGLLIVVKAKSTTHNEFERLLDSAQLANIRVLGSILNGSTTVSQYSQYKSLY